MSAPGSGSGGADDGEPTAAKAARRRRTAIVDALRSRLWPVPAAAVVAAVVFGVALPELDAALDDRLSPTVESYLFGGGADAAREVLGTIATSLMTVTSLTFSLTLVTLQLASSQYTPRLLRTFASDPFVQRTLALFLATFVYALTVLRTVRNDSDTIARFVPKIAVTAAFVLAVASVIALVLFLGHLVRQIRIETMLDHIRTDVTRTADRLLDPLDDARHDDVAPSPPASSSPVPARSSGFLVAIDDRELLAAARAADVVIWVGQPVGSTLVAGTPAAFCSSAGRLDDEQWKKLCGSVSTSLTTDIERTAAHDIGYGLRQISDVVVRALSPGVNDPTTAVHGLHACAAILCDLSGYRLGRRVLRDDDGTPRVVIARPDLPDLLDMVCDQTLLYGATDPAVVTGVLTLLRQVAWVNQSQDCQRAIADRLARVERTVDSREYDVADRLRLAQLGRQVREALAGRWDAG